MMESVQRWLEDFEEEGVEMHGPSASSPYFSIGFIIWYCFLFIFCTLPCTAFVFYRYYWTYHQQQTLEREREEQHQQDLEDISRIEANIHIFSELQSHRRKRMLLRLLKPCTMTVTEKDLKEASGEGVLASGSCNICLEAFQVGQRVVHSSETSSCRHIFHERCIVPWFVLCSHQQCPTCRQEYAVIKEVIRKKDETQEYVVEMVTPRTSSTTLGEEAATGGGAADIITTTDDSSNLEGASSLSEADSSDEISV